MTLPRPVLPRTPWATNDNYASGAAIGTPSKVVPLAGEQGDGHHPSRAPAAQKLNWLLNEHFQWVNYIGDMPILNFPVALGAATVTYVRQQVGPGNLNATADIFWSALLNRWIVTGVNSAGDVYLLDQGLLSSAINTGTTTKVAFGCEAGDRVLLFSGDNRGSAQPIHYSQSAANGAINGGSDKTLPGTIAANAHIGKALASNAPNSAFVFGGRDGNHKVWLTSDSGGTFTENNVGAATGTSYLDRAVVNFDIGRIIAFTNDTTANGGNKLWHSDAGAAGPWTSTTFTYDKNVDILYLPDVKKYVMLCDEGSVLLVTDDPIAGSLTTILNTGAPGSFPVITAIAGFGSVVVLALALSATDTRLYMVDASASVNSKQILRVHDASFGLGSLAVTSIAVNPFGQFAYLCAGNPGVVGASLQSYAS